MQNEHDPAALHAAALVIDTHADTPQRLLDEGWEFTGPVGEGMLSRETARRGNLAAAFFALWAEPTQWRRRYAYRTLALLDSVREQVRRRPDELQLCTTAEEILAARAAGRFGILLGIEGGHSIENSLGLLRLYHALGVRYMTLTWANSNDWAESSGDVEAGGESPAGLTAFGAEVIREMNRLGMMVDVSHASDRTLADVLATTRAPVLASHSSARALTDSPRNLTDAQLRAIAGTGGVVMVNFFPGFIDDRWRLAWAAQRAERQAAHAVLAERHRELGTPIPFATANGIDRAFAARLPRPPLSALIDHIDHIARTAGPEHVGLGTDFDGVPALPEGIETAADLPKITAALMRRSHTATDLYKLLGENLLRVLRRTQSLADTAS